MTAARSYASRPLLLLVLLASFAYLLGCGGSGTTTTPTPSSTISSLSPSSATAGSLGFTLTVNGTGYTAASIVQWNGSSRFTSFTSATQLAANLSSSDVATAGTAQVTVLNLDGTKSAAATFTINAPVLPLPTITSANPASAVAGGSAFTLTLTGTGYRTGSQIEWAGTRIAATTVISATQVSASIPASYITSAGSYLVDVVNTDTGDISNKLPFPVTAAQPTLTSLSPATAVAGGAALTLTVNGTGFTSGAAVAWAGSARATTFISSTQLSAAITATDLATAGSFAVDVAQAGVRSTNQLSFAVTTPVQALTSLAPATIAAGSAGFTLTLNGTAFTSAASVTFNGSAKTTTFVSATQLTAAVTTADLASSGNVTVDVVQAGVHASNTLTFAITAAAPTVTSLSPTSITTGSADTPLTVNGTGFFADSVVKANGTALATTFKSSTLLQATLPAASLVSASTISVTVQNPAGEGGPSNALSLTVSAPVAGKIVQLLSPSYQTGAASNSANSTSPPTLSQDGRYVAFDSYSSDLVAGDTNGQTDAFLRDTCGGASAPSGCAPSTTRISLDPTNTIAAGSNRLVVLSNDGRYAAFTSSNSRDIELRDNCVGATGCTPSTAVASFVPGSTDPGVAGSCCAVLSPDGRYVLFSAFYTTPQNTTGTELLVRDLCTAATSCTPSTTRVAQGPNTIATKQPFQADISTGGRYILFRTAGSDILSTYSSNLHLFVEDTCLGVATGCTISYTPIDVEATGAEGDGNMANDATANEQPSFSKDGRYVVFSSTDANLIAGTTLTKGVSQVYVRDTCIGVSSGCTPTTTLVSADPTALTKGYRSFIGFRSISEHGRYVAYLQEMIDTTINNYVDVVRVRDTCIGAPAGCVPSISTATTDPNSIGVAHSTYLYPSISSDGHYAAFMSGAGQVYLGLTGY